METNQKSSSAKGTLKFLIGSLAGVLLFFIPFTIKGRNSILVDQLCTFLVRAFPTAFLYIAAIVIVIGTILAFKNKDWTKGVMSTVFLVLRCFSCIAIGMYIFRVGPEWLLDEIFGKTVNSIILTGAPVLVFGMMFMTFLMNYGLLDFFGVLAEPIMRPVWKVPGRAAIIAVSAFIGSFSVGISTTDRQYKEGKFTYREAAVINTGFATVSMPFLVTAATALEIMESHWAVYFWGALAVTFAVTAVTTRIWPSTSFPNTYYNDTPTVDSDIKEGNIFKRAWKTAVKVAGNAKPLGGELALNTKFGFLTSTGLLSLIMAIGPIALLLIRFTPIFDYIAYIFYPFAKIVQLPEAMGVAKSVAVTIGEPLTGTVVAMNEGLSLVSRYVVAVSVISEIVFFTGTIPCIFASDVKVSLPKLFVIWIERVILTVVFAAILGHLVC